MLDLLIIGAGPAGILAGYHAKRHGLEYMILEKDKIGQSWRRMFDGMTLLSPGHWKFDWTSLSPDFPIWNMDVHKPFQTVEEFVDYLVAFADEYKLKIMERSEVVDMSVTEDGFRVYTDNFNMDTKNLMLATGVFHNPYTPDYPGISDNPRVHHSSSVKDLKVFKGKKVAIVGSRNSGVELAVALSGDSEVTVICRDKVQYYLNTGLLSHVRGIYEGLFKELIKFNIIHCHENCTIERIEGGRIHCLNMPEMEVDEIIMATGFRSVMPPIMGAEIKTGFKDYPVKDKHGESISVPGLFFAGGIIGETVEKAVIHGFREDIEGTVMAVHEKIHGPMMMM